MVDWIIVVDDDKENLKAAGSILSNAGMRVTALMSGELLLDYIRNNGCPDLILMDVNLQDMDGFETMDLLRRESTEASRVPVVFMTSKDGSELETRSFAYGAMDYIHKPFDPEVLVSRVRKTLEIHSAMVRIEKVAETDQLTGFLNKNAAEAKITELCQTERGLLCVLDLDSFKSVNDLYGHDVGDQVLIRFAQLLKEYPGFVSECGRIGGDEFLVFARNMSRISDLTDFTEGINTRFNNMTAEILGSRALLTLGISVGAVAVPEYGTRFPELFHLADQALYDAKKKGKHGCKLFEADDITPRKRREELDLETITAILEERTVSPNAMWMGREVFSSIYHYMVRYMDRYHSSAYRVLYTIRVKPEVGEATRAKIITHFKKIVRNSLRNSDVMMECGEHQVFLLLPEIQEYDIDRVLDRLNNNWKRSEYANRTDVICEFGRVQTAGPDDDVEAGCGIVVVDDDEPCRNRVGRILAQRGHRAISMSSGRELLDFLRSNRPSMILLDANMPDMDGFETLKRVRSEIDPGRELPVILLTGEDSTGTEEKGLKLGVMDFLRKPFGQEALNLRVQHALELLRLQRNLSSAVMRKTRENEKLSLQVVQTLAEAIDAKDQYSNGHSGRVAEYAREIARRYGYTWGQQNEIYLMGLLHDVGRIGVPDAIINKPGKLTEEEFEVMRTHPVAGAKILSRIENMPRLVEGARWHHERYDGGGYPDGLVGNDIPEHARIIAVADAYDAMSSRRSYRGMLTQAQAREQIEQGKGAQFDPVFADIMLAIIDDDPDYMKREPDRQHKQ